MSSPSQSSVTLLRRWQPHVEACPCPTTLYLCRGRLQTARPPVFMTDSVGFLLSPGDPISVVFPYEGEPGVIVPTTPTPYPPDLSWHGVPAHLVRVRIGLPVVGSDVPRQFRLLALVPLQNVEDVPPVIRLGAEFLHAHRADVRLSAATGEGRLVIPYP